MIIQYAATVSDSLTSQKRANTNCINLITDWRLQSVPSCQHRVSQICETRSKHEQQRIGDAVAQRTSRSGE